MKESIIVGWPKVFAFSLFDLRTLLPSLQHQIVSSDPLPNIVDLVDDSLKVGSGIVRAGDEDVVGLARGCGSV